jgi:hypothetical protein
LVLRIKKINWSHVHFLKLLKNRRITKDQKPYESSEYSASYFSSIHFNVKFQSTNKSPIGLFPSDRLINIL